MKFFSHCQQFAPFVYSDRSDCRYALPVKRKLCESVAWEGQCQRCHSFGIKSEACQSCRQWPVYLLGNRAIWPYEDDWQQVILDFKFRNKPWLAEALAAELLPVLPTNFDLLVPVPLHPNRLRERGYNQSALLAKALAEQSGMPWQACLQRVRDTPHQTGLTAANG